MPDIDEIYDLNPEGDININPGELDVEWMRQPGLMLKYSRACDQAAKEAADSKNSLEVIRAEVAMDVRANPAKYGIGTSKAPTVDAVNTACILSDKVKKAEADLSQANHAHKMLLSAVRALEMKKSALENAVKMVTLGYFAAPASPREINELTRLIEARSDQKSADKKVRSAVDERRLKRGK